MTTLRVSCASFLLLCACGDDGGGPDPVERDAAAADTGAADTGAADTGAADTGAADTGAADTGAADSATPACPDLRPSGAPELVISKIDLATGQVELFNPGASDLVLGDHAWCVRPAYPDVASTGPTTVPAGGYAVYTLPAEITLDPAGGELALYSSGPFGIPDNMLDYVCWGTGKGSPNRATEARDGAHWTGSCAPAPTAGAIVRLPETGGVSADSYDTTATFSPTACD